MEALAAHDARFSLARRVITRPSDAGGEVFESVSNVGFQTRKTAGTFALNWSAHGLHYGIPAEVDETLANGQDVLANLSRAVLAQANARFVRFEVVNLTADRAVLARRLTARGRESAQEIEKRLAHTGATLPQGLTVHEIDNSGTLTQTMIGVIACLYPVRLQVGM